MPKFDLAVMNPPYGDSIHLEIFDMISDHCNTVCVFPFTWCAKHNINLPKGKWREKLQGKIDSVTYYDHRTANDIFGTGNSIEDLAVVTTKPNTKFDLIHYGFKNIKEYNLYKKIDFYTNKGCKTMSSAKSKSGKFGGTAEMFRTMKPKFYVPIYQWHDGKNCFDACVIQDKKKIDKGCSYFRFDSEQEKINFIDSLHTTFMDWFYYSFIVPGDYKEQAYLFRMQDYTKPWDDKRFCEYFGITGYVDDDHAEPGSEWETILNTMKEENMPKFDLAVMNPPYDGNLHLKILEKVIPIADKVVNISPIRWLQDQLAKYKPKKANLQEKYKNILSVLESLTIIPASDANKLFNINWCDLGIYVIDKNCKNPYKIIEHPGVKIIDKIQFNKSCSLRDVMSNEKDIYFCPITHAMRAVNCAHGYTILFTDNGPYAKSGWTKDAGNSYHFINLNNKNEVDNFKKYVTTKSVRFICKLVTLGGMGGQNNLIPYMGDYSKPWDDKRFCEYFGITGYIDDDHAEPNSEWETILNTMKKYV